MTIQPAPSSAQQQASDADQCRLDFVLEQYRERIDYYWKTSRANKNGYKYSRYLTILLGSVVTLITALAASEQIKSWELQATFQILAPVLAAILTIVGGFTQSFHWGSAWREMVLTALRLEQEYDRLRVLPDDQRDPVAEIERLYELVLTEGQSFFERLVGVGAKDEKEELEALLDQNRKDQKYKSREVGGGNGESA